MVDYFKLLHQLHVIAQVVFLNIQNLTVYCDPLCESIHCALFSVTRWI